MILGWILDLKNKNKIETTINNDAKQKKELLNENNEEIDAEEVEVITQNENVENTQKSKK